ncbi:PIR Superfamily Protein [Plasmodium ovale wallikeri]|uniref:PIR Superfamily Protein n=1 Tax=Plasmodium ovale wallikeri TaxID=864142 RepID=A0A1A9ARK5_PLAOA|nr:PIR Superfamily Protein [Plasmodium ovale wallikeri]
MPTATLEVHFHSPTVKRTWDEAECLEELSQYIEDVEGKILELDKTGDDEQKFKNICNELSTRVDDTKKTYGDCFREIFSYLYTVTENKVKVALKKCATANEAHDISPPDHKEPTNPKEKEGSQEQNGDCNKEADPQTKKCQTLLEHEKKSHPKGDSEHQEGGDQKTKSVQLKQKKEDIPPNLPPIAIPSKNLKETMEIISGNGSHFPDTLITDMGDLKVVLTTDGSEHAGGSDRSSDSSQERSKDNLGTNGTHSTGNKKDGQHLLSGSGQYNIGFLHKGESSTDSASPRARHLKSGEISESEGHVHSVTEAPSAAKEQINRQHSPDMRNRQSSPKLHASREDNHRNPLSSQGVDANSQEEHVRIEDEKLSTPDNESEGFSPNMYIIIILGILTLLILLFLLIKIQYMKRTLPSVIFLKFLYDNNNVIEKLEGKIELYKSDGNYEEIISIIEGEFEKIQSEIKETFTDDYEICCRNINYYIDLLRAIIKSANVFSKVIQNNIIDKVEEQWKKILKIKDINECTKEIDLDSIRKRCILKHLHDLKLDKKLIMSNLDVYKTFLQEKWEKIIGYTNPEHGHLYIKIENDSVGIIEEYSNFLYSYDYICDFYLDKLSSDDITISTDIQNLINNISLDKILSNNVNKTCYNENYIKMLKTKTTSIQRMNNFLSIGIALLGFSLIFIFLYRFSPLGNILRRYKKNKNEVDENTNEEFPELYENTENIGRYISYTSESH